MLHPLHPLVLALALAGCSGADLEAAKAVEASAGAAISSACSSAYGRARSDAASLERVSSVCKPALDAYDAHEAARKTLAALLDAGASEANLAAARATLAAAGAALAAAVANLGRLP